MKAWILLTAGVLSLSANAWACEECGGKGDKAAMQIQAALAPFSVPASASGRELLGAVLRRYEGLKTYQARVMVLGTATGFPSLSQTRAIAFERPNKFRIAIANLEGKRVGPSRVAVSDGKKFVSYSPQEGVTTQLPAPRTLFLPPQAQIDDFADGQSLLLAFFGGEKALGRIVAPKASIERRSNETINGASCFVVAFRAPGEYGNTRVYIGPDGLVRRIAFDMATVLEEMRKSGQRAPAAVSVTETFSQIAANATLPVSTFDTTIPRSVQLASSRDEDAPPVPLGSAAPNFEVVALNGTKRKLSDFKGRVVLLDFWATWCPPCRESLPETQRLHAQYGNKGLAVMAISDENAGTVTPFLNAYKYTFPTFLDASNAASRAYKIEGIPTFAVIDARGKLRAFFVGLPPEGALTAALKKAGLKM